ncbi:antibiotic biosynthesis monooxygenase family protein [Asaia astilbis]|uniref:antibiotic biosynthesis monooxygenase family protein n=1 Tax=Asaia astilbis TaxID=610244 RepID=UPI00046F9AF7|nr:hypothetical protein [Asaia astilbis]
MKTVTCEIVRRFVVAPNQIETFESSYGSDGPWARLFRNVPSYRGTKLIADVLQTGRYIAIDEWSSYQAYLDFKNDHSDAFAALDSACGPLIISVEFFGAFRVVRSQTDIS